MYKTAHHKKAMVEAMIKTLGIVTPALKIADVGRATYYGWLKTDAVFAKRIADTADVAMDFAESKLHKLIHDENPAAVIFYAKTKLRFRGYVERMEHDHSGNVSISPKDWCD